MENKNIPVDPYGEKIEKNANYAKALDCLSKGKTEQGLCCARRAYKEIFGVVITSLHLIIEFIAEILKFRIKEYVCLHLPQFQSLIRLFTLCLICNTRMLKCRHLAESVDKSFRKSPSHDGFFREMTVHIVLVRFLPFVAMVELICQQC